MFNKPFNTKVLAIAVGATLSTYGLNGHAAGFYLQEQSVSGLGAAFAGQVAKARDASVTYFNPAAMSKLDQSQWNIGLNVISPTADITDTGTTLNGTPMSAIAGLNPNYAYGDGGNPYDPTLVPNFSWAYKASDKIWLGLNFSVPFGLSSEFDDNFFARYDSKETHLKTFDLAPVISYTFNNQWTIGGGINIQHASAELITTVIGPTLQEGSISLEGDDTYIGYNIGVLYSPTTSTDIGLHYRSAIQHQLSGDVAMDTTAATIISGSVAQASQGQINIPAAALGSYPGSVELSLPDIAQLGFSHQLNSQWSLLGTVTWFGWSNFDTLAIQGQYPVLPAVPQNYEDTTAIALGAEYIMNNNWTLRGGYQFDETPTVDNFRTTRTPDGDRNWFSLGATYNISNTLSLDLAGTYITVDEGDINLTRNSGAVNIDAKSEGEVIIFGAALNFKF